MGGDSLGLETEGASGFQDLTPHIQCKKADTAIVVHFVENFFRPEQTDLPVRHLISVLNPLLLGFHELLFHAQPLLPEPYRFVQKQNGFFHGEIIQKRYSAFPFLGKFYGRTDRDLRQILDRPLGLHVKSPDRVHLFVPHFDTHREFLRQRIDVQNPAPDGILPVSFYLNLPVISKLCQTFLYFSQIQGTVVLNPEKSFTDHFPGNQRIQECVEACDNGHRLFLCQRLYHFHTLAQKLLAAQIRLVEQQIFRRIQIGLGIKETILLIDLLCLQFTGTGDDFVFQAIAQRIHHMCLLGTDASADTYHSPLFRPILIEFFKLRQFI